MLDTSGSMKGGRLARLKSALNGLTGDFREREQVTLLPFGSTVKQVRTHTVDPADPKAGPAAIRADAAALTAEGDTAIYSSLAAAYDHLGPDTESAFTSVVLMTDGENTAGRSAAEFAAFYRALPAARQVTPVFPIVFGDSDRSELESIASLTGGRLLRRDEGGGSRFAGRGVRGDPWLPVGAGTEGDPWQPAGIGAEGDPWRPGRPTIWSRPGI